MKFRFIEKVCFSFYSFCKLSFWVIMDVWILEGKSVCTRDRVLGRFCREIRFLFFRLEVRRSLCGFLIVEGLMID